MIHGMICLQRGVFRASKDRIFWEFVVRLREAFNRSQCVYQMADKWGKKISSPISTAARAASSTAAAATSLA